MLVDHDPRNRDLEDVLRSVGALLDGHLARAILIKEVEHGLLLRARVAATLDQRLDGTLMPLERVFGDHDLLEQQLAAVARRGTGHLAGPIERALRTIGRMIDERELAGFLLIQHETDGAWLLWHQAITDGRAELLAFTNGELEQLDVAVTPARRIDDLSDAVATARVVPGAPVAAGAPPRRPSRCS